MLWCIKWFNLPFLSINDVKIINISYKYKYDLPIACDKFPDIFD